MRGWRSRWARVWCGGALPSAALAFAALALPAVAQFPDVLSESECPGCSARFASASLDGVWSSAFTAAVEHGWALDDYFCIAACTVQGRAAAARLLAGSETARHSALELYPHAVAANVRSVERLVGAADPARPSTLPGLSCDRLGFAAQVVSPLPVESVVGPDRVRLRYEESGAERTISLSGHAAHGDHASLGASKGRVEDGALVVETHGIPAGRLSDWLGGFAHSDALRAIERYSISADGRWLELELTLDDPETLAEPLVVTKHWLRAPGARIAQHRCDVMSAGLTGVFAEYLDPRIIDARRHGHR